MLSTLGGGGIVEHCNNLVPATSKKYLVCDVDSVKKIY